MSTHALKRAAEAAAHLRGELEAIAEGVDYVERTAPSPDPERRELARRLDVCAGHAGLLRDVLDDAVEAQK